MSRSLFLCTALVTTLTVLAGGVTAEAGRKHRSHDGRDVELVRPLLGPDADASGVLRVKTSKRGEKGVLKLRNLDPRTRYEVRDAATDELLGTVRTNRRGKAKMKLRRRVRDAGKSASFEMPERIEIYRMDDDHAVLMGDTDGSVLPEIDLPSFAFERYDGAEGWRGFVDMFSFPAKDVERFSLSLKKAPAERGQRGDVFDYTRGPLTDEGLPLDVETVADLAGRAFRVVTADGTVLLRGVLPELEQPELRMPPMMDWLGDGPREGGSFGDCPFQNDDEADDAEAADGPAKMGGFMDRMPSLRDMPDFGRGRGDRDRGDRMGGGRGLGDLLGGMFDMDEMFGMFDMDDMFDIMPPDFMPFPQPEREPSRLRLEIADDDGNLTDVGNLDRIVFPDVDWADIDFDWDCPRGDHDDDMHDGDDDDDMHDGDDDAANDHGRGSMMRSRSHR